MYTLCWSPKGGSGTTVVACSLALLAARHEPTVLLDLGGDAAPALGVTVTNGPGVGDWLAAPNSPPDALWRLGTEVVAGLTLVSPGTMGPLTEVNAERLAAAAATAAFGVVIDAGTHTGPDVLHHSAELSLLVIRPCYLAIRRAVAFGGLATGFVLVDEPARALGGSDVERAVGAPQLAHLRWDPAIARAVDAGILAGRLPASLERPLRPLQQLMVVA
ncbi:MAG: hypothetical protein ACOYL9_08925 [Ilumatobacteraceae bacterium]